MQLTSIRTEHDLTPEVIRELRLSRGLSLSKFWEPAGLSKGSAHVYEPSANREGKSLPMPRRRLLFLHHVVGLNVDTGDEQNVANLRALAALQDDTASLLRMGSTRAQLEQARQRIDAAIEAINQIDGVAAR